jgi:hypothetical protein
MTRGIFFKSPQHKERFMETMEQIGRIYDGDRYDAEYGAAVYVFTCDSSTWARAKDYVTHDRIDTEGMLKDCDWSGGYRRLVRLAGNLFNSFEPVDLADVINAVDEDNFKVMISSIYIRRHGLRVADLNDSH